MGIFDIFTRMDQTILEKKDKETLKSGLKRLGIFLLVIGIIGGVVVQFILPLYPQFGPLIIGAFPIPPIILIPVIVVIGGLILGLLGNLIIWISAKLFGGTGSFGSQVGVYTLIIWPTFVFVVLIALLNTGVGAILYGSLFSIIALIPLYFLITVLSILLTYFNIVVPKQVHNLTTFRAALSLGLSVMIWIIIAIVIAFIGFVWIQQTVLTSSGIVQQRALEQAQRAGQTPIATAQECSGNLIFSFNPTSVSPNDVVTWAASGLFNCNNKVNIFESGSSLGELCSGKFLFDCLSPSFCTSTLAAPNIAGTYYYWACIDTNNDGDTYDPGESDWEVLTVT